MAAEGSVGDCLEGRVGGEQSANKDVVGEDRDYDRNSDEDDALPLTFHNKDDILRKLEVLKQLTHMGSEYVSREKKFTMVNFLIFVQKNVSTIRFQEIKIRPFQDFEKKAFFSLFLMRKRLSSGQKWFLRPYFPLIRGMFLLRSGLRFSFLALEVPEPRVRKRPY